MKILSLDLSSSTGYSVLEDGRLIDYGTIVVKVEDFNVNNNPELSIKYPYNMVDAANQMANKIADLVRRSCPTHIVIENTVKGRNRHTQRILEFIHKSVLDELRDLNTPIAYKDPSWWRSKMEVRLTKEDKKNNQLVSQGKKRGRIGKKHLSVRHANSLFDLQLKLKDDDIADSIMLAFAYYKSISD